MTTRHCFFLLFLPGWFSLASQAQTSVKPSLLAGAAKVDITPKPDALPAGYKRIRDHLYTRAIVVSNGTTKAALITGDIGGFPDGYWYKLTQRITKETGIPAEHVLLSATHSHSSPFVGGGFGQTDPKMAAYTSLVESSMLQAVQQSVKNLQPARVGFGTGSSPLNVNRDVINPKTRLWSQGPNYDGPSDKTVAVVNFETLTGEPIAVFMNYAVHANTMFMSGSISGDLPGETSRYIEESFANKVVALWTSGAAGDQNPRYLQPMSDVNQVQIDAAIASGKAKATDDAIMYLFRGGEVDVPVKQQLLDRQSQLISSMGQLLGEEVLKVMTSIDHPLTDTRLWAAQDTVTCPGRNRTNTGREGAPGTYVDGNPVNIRLGLLRVGDIAFATVNGEVYNPIAQRLKREAPFAHTMMVTITNGMANSGYIPSDDAFGRYTFQVLGSRLKPGCAEDAVVNGLLSLMARSEKNE